MIIYIFFMETTELIQIFFFQSLDFRIQLLQDKQFCIVHDRFSECVYIASNLCGQKKGILFSLKDKITKVVENFKTCDKTKLLDQYKKIKRLVYN